MALGKSGFRAEVIDLTADDILRPDGVTKPEARRRKCSLELASEDAVRFLLEEAERKIERLERRIKYADSVLYEIDGGLGNLCQNALDGTPISDDDVIAAIEIPGRFNTARSALQGEIDNDIGMDEEATTDQEKEDDDSDDE
jgi:hypothetical protein